MNESKKITGMYKDTPVPVKIKLTALWTAVMFLYVYADIKALYQTGVMESIIKGEIIGIPINQIFLMSSALLMSIPALMIILSLLLKPRINRIVNIIFAVLFTVVNISTYFTPGKVWYYYIYFTILENIINGIIIWFAWKWPKNEDRP